MTSIELVDAIKDSISHSKFWADCYPSSLGDRAGIGKVIIKAGSTRLTEAAVECGFQLDENGDAVMYTDWNHTGRAEVAGYCAGAMAGHLRRAIPHYMKYLVKASEIYHLV